MSPTIEEMREALAEANEYTPLPWRERTSFVQNIFDGLGNYVAQTRFYGPVTIDDAVTKCVLLLNHLPALLDRLEAAEKALAWRPIESAPKDGTPILVHCKNGASYGVWWSRVSDTAHMLEPCWCVIGGGELARKTSDARTPTHWQPLPVLPSGDAT